MNVPAMLSRFKPLGYAATSYGRRALARAGLAPVHPPVGLVIERADGVPLFVEELTRSVLESGLLRDADGQLVVDGPLPPLAIPTTLQGSLLARLDRLSATREVAQIGSAIGREFDYQLLAAVADLAAAAVGCRRGPSSKPNGRPVVGGARRARARAGPRHCVWP